MRYPPWVAGTAAFAGAAVLIIAGIHRTHVAACIGLPSAFIVYGVALETKDAGAFKGLIALGDASIRLISPAPSPTPASLFIKSGLGERPPARPWWLYFRFPQRSPWFASFYLTEGPINKSNGWLTAA